MTEDVSLLCLVSLTAVYLCFNVMLFRSLKFFLSLQCWRNRQGRVNQKLKKHRFQAGMGAPLLKMFTSAYTARTNCDLSFKGPKLNPILYIKYRAQKSSVYNHHQTNNVWNSFLGFNHRSVDLYDTINYTTHKIQHRNINKQQ